MTTEDIIQRLQMIQEKWASVRDRAATYQAQWQNAQNTLPSDAPEVVDETLATLVKVSQRIGQTSGSGRALKLAITSASQQLVRAEQLLTQISNNNNWNQLPDFINSLSAVSSAIYGIYILSSQEGQNEIKKACIQLIDEHTSIEQLHERLQEIEQHASELKQSLQEAVTQITQQQETSQQHTEQAEAWANEAEQFRNAAETAAQQAQSHEQEITELAEQAEQLRSATETAAQQAQSHEQEITELVEQAEQFRNAAETAAQQAQSHEQEITELAEQAEQLKSDIDTRIEASQTAQKRLEALTKEAEEIRKTLESLLPGATAAGLAKAYRQSKIDIEQRMKKLFKQFIWGLLALMVSIGLGHVILPSLPDDPVHLMLQLLARGMLAAPAIWFTWVVVRQYAYLSRLHTDYSFKEAMATSFEGFRRMMEELDENEHKELTAALSIRAIDIIGADPGRLNVSHQGDESPFSFMWRSLMERMLPNNKKQDNDS